MMTYIEKTENELRVLLSGSTDEGIIAWVKERILESYRNGQANGVFPVSVSLGVYRGETGNGSLS